MASPPGGKCVSTTSGSPYNACIIVSDDEHRTVNSRSDKRRPICSSRSAVSKLRNA
eukprot:CAMPEP_0118936532 /NCGR_PEP_ID=MMETSP1169-20130426/19367_1 /TAXON_ID=36882 /ORGANISM="Pyramimonas obovata, Strain CCMP722" /LENGTH=55 /DNA_ID=CAMNT_0006879829 /DNA_START=79 /DNA_END=242 /DNA_ORIENTATION=-